MGRLYARPNHPSHHESCYVTPSQSHVVIAESSLDVISVSQSGTLALAHD